MTHSSNESNGRTAKRTWRARVVKHPAQGGWRFLVNTSRAVSLNRHDRAFCAGIAIALALTVFVGFGPTYYFHINSPSPMTTLSGGPVTLIVHVHATLFTVWILLIVQTPLVAQRKIDLHRRLGIAGAALAAPMVVSGTLTALKMVAH